jgi:hypothetical protein
MKLLLNFSLIFFLFSTDLYGADLSVTPLYFDMQKKKKNYENFEIKVGASSASIVKVTPFVAKQGLSGGLEFAELRDTPIIKLKKDTIVFNRKEVKTLSGRINFPKNINQTLVYALMIEEEKRSKVKGVSINVRYAVVFKIGTSGKRIFEKGSVRDIKLVKHKNVLLIQSTFTNETLKDFQVESVAYVRNSKNKLIAKVDLKTASSWKKKSVASIVFPETSVYIVGELKGVTVEGNYNITILSRINGKRQFVSKTKVEIKERDLPKVVEKVEKITLFPGDIKIKMNPKRKSYFRLKVSNDYKVNKSIQLIGESSVVDNIRKRSVTFFPETVSLKAGQSKTVLITVENSMDKSWQPDSLKMIVDIPDGVSPMEFSIPLSLNYME